MSGASHFEGSTEVLSPSGARGAVPDVEIEVIEGPDRGKSRRVEAGVARIGTAKTNDLILVDRAVSRLHCEIVVRDKGVTLIDRSSTNGTYVDGRRVRDIDLTDGTIVRMGESALRVGFSSRSGSLGLSERSSFGDLVGASVEMRRIYGILERVAPTDTTILILGETGTGKEVVAQAIHEASGRASRPFVTLDCGSIPETLIESELFGHVRGAFTGAATDRRGVFEEANGGTLFIDEIGELPLMMQPKLLRALEARKVRRVGANQAVPVDVRVIAATNRALFESVNRGTFRDDLYYRLAVVEVELPPLRARTDDIPALVAHFLERLTGSPSTPPAELLSSLVGRAWPGNVRELRNAIERSISLGWDSVAASRTAAPSSPSGGSATNAGSLPVLAAPPIHLPLKEARLAWTEQFEDLYVRALLEKTGGNVTRAAAMAGVNRRFLQRMMVRLGMRGDGDDE